MKRKLLSVIALLLALCMCGSIFAACNKTEEETSGTQATGTEESENTTGGTDVNTEDTTDITSETNTETETETEPILLDGEFGPAISNANKLANQVQAYYSNPQRQDYHVENMNMSLDYELVAGENPKVTALSNSKGQPYLQNTMDAYIKMENGSVYYASQTSNDARPNIFKYGYYYYEVHFLDHNFAGDFEISAEKEFQPKHFQNKSTDVSKWTHEDGVVSFTIGGGDPYVYTTDKVSFDAEKFNAIQITVKSTRATDASLYFVSGSQTGHTPDQCVTFSLKNDGEFHTYTVVLSGVPDYGDTVKRLRFDVNDGSSGDVISISGIKAVKVESDVPSIVFDRTLHTYSDKMNQVLHFIAQETTTGIAAFGMTTKIAAETVDKLIVKDAKGTHTSLDGVDWNTAEYVGFDIKGVGVFGYILLPHENSGKLTVTLEDGNYIIDQAAAPKNGTLNKMSNYTSNDFFMGQRLYTDMNHTFDAFLKEAEYERNPMTTIGGDAYVGYDALRGAYEYAIGGTGFNNPFFTSWNRHYTAGVTVTGTDEDRAIYMYSNCASNGGSTEGAALLDENDLLIPIPMMIFKNFGGENEEPIYYHGDRSYSISLFPMTVEANQEKSFTIVNTMQNWGAFPLKQLSSIQFYAPYYHLSTGVTETSCIAPWYVHGKSLWTLPDFRPMSGIWWFDYTGELRDNQPQHTHAGYHYFLQYTDADGNYYASENIKNTIISSGQNYAEVLMEYISDDGKIYGTFNHIEMPQTDEHRAYYEIVYEVLEDVSFENFKREFSFFSTKAYAGTYQKMGYVDENNEIVHTDALKNRFILLGDECPYVSFYNLKGAWENKCGNTGFVLYNWDMTIGGEKYDGNFGLLSREQQHYLTLDLEEVTLKKGDKFIINMVIAPWGSEQSTDDSNMIKLRENTCLNPLTVTVSKGEKIESVFVPRVKTDDGKTAEFTLSGGYNNSVVRIYGFDKLTAPKLYEKINGEWVEYVTNSTANPDANGTMHYYDGFFVYYDGDGTYSYTFLVDMTDAEERTFKIDASEDFKGWPEDIVIENKDPLNAYADPEDIVTQANTANGVGKTVLSEDKSYVSIYADGESPEAYFTAFVASEMVPTGQYLVIKYRFPTTNSKNSDFQIFTSTVNSGAVAADNFYIRELVTDGKWHLAVIDLSKQNLPTFEAGTGEKYYALYLRIDIWEGVTPADCYVDLAYIGISDSIDDICKLNSDLGTATMHTRGPITELLNLTTGEITTYKEGDDLGGSDEIEITSGSAESFIHAESSMKVSDKAYIARIDFVNGTGDGQENSPAYDSTGACSTSKVDVIAYNNKTVEGQRLSLAGWAMVYGGIEKYIWSADGGKTWQDCTLYNREALSDASEAMIGVAESGTGKGGFAQYVADSNFQGGFNSPSGITAELTDYVGKTVQVTFAAVPKGAPDTLCILVSISGVQVVE